MLEEMDRGLVAAAATVACRRTMGAKSVAHNPCAKEVKLLLIEPRAVVRTGEGATGVRTVENDWWI